MGDERRASPRIEASFEVQILGIDARAVLRRGDIGLSGLFIETDADPGEPGTIRGLRLRSRDKAIRVEIPGRVVRVSCSDDLMRGRVVTGVAFELLAYEPGKREELDALVAHVARHRLAAQRDAEEPAKEVKSVTVETDWRLRKGERVRVEVPTPAGRSVCVEGRAVRSRKSKSGTYRTKVDVTSQSQPMDRSIPSVREALSVPPPAPSRPSLVVPKTAPQAHLEGDLARLALPSVLSLAGMERMTGVLRFSRDAVCVEVYVENGEVVDAFDPGEPDVPPRELLGELLHWREGRFALSFGPVSRPRRLAISTTALLLDLAREHDELQRDVA